MESLVYDETGNYIIVAIQTYTGDGQIKGVTIVYGILRRFHCCGKQSIENRRGNLL